MSVFRVELNAGDGGAGSTSGFLTVGDVRLGPPRFRSGDRGRLSFAEANVDNTGCAMWDVAGCDREGDRDMRLADPWRSQEGGDRLGLDKRESGEVLRPCGVKVGLEGKVVLIERLVVRQPRQPQALSEAVVVTDDEHFGEDQFDEAEVVHLRLVRPAGELVDRLLIVSAWFTFGNSDCRCVSTPTGERRARRRSRGRRHCGQRVCVGHWATRSPVGESALISGHVRGIGEALL
jgi:hypothetical protein